MADSRLPVFNADGATAYIDIRTEGSNGEGRQVIVFGDPSDNAAVAAVVSADPGPSSSVYGVVMRLAGSATITGTLTGITNSIGVHLLNTGGTLRTKLDPESVISGIQSSINVRILQTAGTIVIKLDPDHNITQKARSSSGTFGRTTINAGVRQIIGSNVTRKSVAFVHDSFNTVYIGLSNAVTSGVLGTGFPIVGNQILGFDEYTGAVFGTTESGEAIIKYIEL